MTRLALGGVTWGLVVILVGCTPEVEISVEAQDVIRRPGVLLSQVAGTWPIHAYTFTDCPAEWQHTFPTGRTEWRDEGDHLSMSFLTDAVTPLRLWPQTPSHWRVRCT